MHQQRTALRPEVHEFVPQITVLANRSRCERLEKCDQGKAYYERKNSLALNERDVLLGDGLLDKTDRWCARLLCSFQDPGAGKRWAFSDLLMWMLD